MAACLVRCDHERIVFGTPRHLRLVGLVLVGLGLALLVLGIVLGIVLPVLFPVLREYAWVFGQFLAFLFLSSVVFFVLGCLKSLWVDELQLDCLLQSYRRRRGLLPFAQSWSGTYDDFDHLVMRRHRVETRKKDFEAWSPFLVWKDSSRRDVQLILPTEPLSESDEHPYRQALQYLLEMARCFFWRDFCQIERYPLFFENPSPIS